MKDYKSFHKFQVNHPKWKAKAREIKERDNFQCQKCGSDENLNVHHKLYIPDRSLWDYPDDFLITLCIDCHKIEHESAKVIKETIEDCKLMMFNTEIEEKIEPLKLKYTCKECGEELTAEHIRAFGQRCLMC